MRLPVRRTATLWFCTNASQRPSGDRLGRLSAGTVKIPHDAEAPWLLAGTGRIAGCADVVGQPARPLPAAEAHLDRALVAREPEVVERQAKRRVLLAGRFRERRRQPLVIERGPLLQRPRVDDHELEPAAEHGPAIVKAVRIADPRRGIGQVVREVLPPLAKREGAVVVGRARLSLGVSDAEHKADEQARHPYPRNRSHRMLLLSGHK